MPYTSSWRCPSNIALVKYWGKHGSQLPNNPSLSFTLSACHTDMTIIVSTEVSSSRLSVLYDGTEKPAFHPKILSFFSRIHHIMPWIANADILINSKNTFPHGAGIASSASSMGALALCLASVNEQLLQEKEMDHNANRLRIASELARLGSGSASRSVFPVAAIWGKVSTIPQSQNEFAIPWAENVSSVFHDYQDTILVVSSIEKSVSSTQGHDLMIDHFFASSRYAEAEKNLNELIHIMQSGNHLDQFVSVCEAEALQIHALMMTGNNPFILMEPGTISIIKEVWRFRAESGIPVCFTLDAGPNVHLLYPKSFAPSVMSWVRSSLSRYCADGFFIEDCVGGGPEALPMN